jgi:hypothetical protein
MTGRLGVEDRKRLPIPAAHRHATNPRAWRRHVEQLVGPGEARFAAATQPAVPAGRPLPDSEEGWDALAGEPATTLADLVTPAGGEPGADGKPWAAA